MALWTLGRKFEEKYCSDILEEVRLHSEVDTSSEDYDDIIDDDYGLGKICVVYAGEIPIDIEDMFTIDLEEFKYRYCRVDKNGNMDTKPLTVREQYRSRFKITEGKALFEEELTALIEEQNRIARDAAMYQEVTKNVEAVSVEEGSDISRRLLAGGF